MGSKYTITIPMSMSAEKLKEMDFYNLFQMYFLQSYDLKVTVKETGENESEMIFVGSHQAAQAVISVLKEMGLKVAELPKNQNPDGAFH